MSDYTAGGRPVSGVPFTTEAKGMAEVARAGRQRIGFPVGWWGMAILVASESTLFGSFFGTYYYLRFQTARWPPAGVPDPKVVVPLVLASVLVATSVPMQAASLWARAGRLGLARVALVTALVVQSGYLAFQISRYYDDLQTFRPSGSAYASIYYTLLGADHAHVFVGLLLDVWLLTKLAGGLTTYRLNALRAVTFYWHAVNVLTLCVAGTIVSAAV